MSNEAPLSIDQAVSELTQLEPPKPEEAETTNAVEEVEAEDTELDGEPETIDADEEPDDSEVNLEDEEVEEVEAEEDVPSIDAPQFWTDGAKDVFSSLPAEAQSVIADEVKRSQAETTRAQQAAAEATKQSVQRMEELHNVIESVHTETATLDRLFDQRWKDVNWVEMSQRNPSEYLQNKALFEAESQALEVHKESAVTAQKEYEQQILQENFANAPKLFPDLLDVVKGPEIQQTLTKTLLSLGATPEELRFAKPGMLALAYDGIKYRDSQKKLSKTSAKPVPKAIKSKGKSAGNANSLRKARAAKRFNKSNSLDDAVALLLSS